ncbi:ribonuclease III [Candidatus Falkowbacteria bacterium CG_4_10_14_0_2_um_filter_41_15]|uniref:Ribonuclease 3 n=2 Tax=Candidatus Falkowiibacteriota TaxID=1752728 RepID=A0A1J4TBY0_9BACT|nr:MAG: ribonuclease III [Candidatus Falkowbacteria bacterium CG1_02_41_21]PJA09437.1 MAG: ribonuclease III [Candidatus Falkowbacteria bacterium CG_4_10_14_0_2_um_filter_41_15]
MSSLVKLEEAVGINFQNKDLLKQALTHRSYLNEHPEFKFGQNERLEFLGDAVLEIIVTEYLFVNFPNTPEGDLTNWRASLVNAKMLYQVANNLGVENYLLLSKGEAKDKNTKARQYILANSIEAIIGAIYLDQGIETAKGFIVKNIISQLDAILKNQTYLDPKSKFQELAQEKEGITPIYKTIREEGPDHEKLFTVGLYLGEELISEGDGLSKQEAQVKAAEMGLEKKGW